MIDAWIANLAKHRSWAFPSIRGISAIDLIQDDTERVDIAVSGVVGLLKQVFWSHPVDMVEGKENQCVRSSTNLANID